MIAKALAYLNRCIEIVVMVLFAVMIAVIFGQVIGRFVFNTGFGWSEEVARYSFIWLSFLGGSVGVYKKAHLGIESLTSKLSPRLQRILATASAVLCGVLFVLVLYYGWRIWPFVSRQTAPGLQMSLRWVYLAIPVGGALMCLYTLADIYRLCAGGGEERKP